MPRFNANVVYRMQRGAAPHRLACVSLSLMSPMPFSFFRLGAYCAR